MILLESLLKKEFKLIDHTRDGRRGGGTALLVKDSLHVKKGGLW